MSNTTLLIVFVALFAIVMVSLVIVAVKINASSQVFNAYRKGFKDGYDGLTKSIMDVAAKQKGANDAAGDKN